MKICESCVVQNNIQTHGTYTASTEARGGMCTDDCGSACMEFYTEITRINVIICTYISTKGVGVHGVVSTDDSMVNTVVRGITNAYDKYRKYKPIWGIGTDVVGKLRKGISYADDVHWGF